jgi:hypothetical protein
VQVRSGLQSKLALSTRPVKLAQRQPVIFIPQLSFHLRLADQKLLFICISAVDVNSESDERVLTGGEQIHEQNSCEFVYELEMELQ